VPTIDPVRATGHRPWWSARRLTAAGIAGLGLVLAGCSNKGPQSTFRPEGTYARKIDHLIRPILYIALGILILVTGAVLTAVVKFRARKGDTRVPRQVHGNTPLEIMWTIAPAVLLAVIAVPTIKTVFDIARTPKNAMEIDVIGQQWWWEFQYHGNLQGIITANDLVIPAGTNIQLKIQSRDVIHSFWLPRLNGKRDAVPNRSSFLNIEADTLGTYTGQCTEFCGLSHANMRERVIVLSPADFNAWAANQLKPAAAPTDAAAIRGAQSFVARCSSCHQITGEYVDTSGKAVTFDKVDASASLVSGAAPNLTHLMSRGVFAGGTLDLHFGGDPTKAVDTGTLASWLRDPGKLVAMAPNERRGMPTLGLTEDQIFDLVSYLSTLK
jgi:cytochrome c oxidase subunit 2